MLQYIISNKVEKSKQNIDSYLNNSALPHTSLPKEQPAPQAQSAVTGRPAQQPASNFMAQTTNNAANNLNKSKFAKNQIQLKSITVGGKNFSKDGFYFKFNKEDGRFQFFYEQDNMKTKIQSKKDYIINKRVKGNIAQGSLTFQMKQSLLKKQDTKDTGQKTGPINWSAGKQLLETTVIIYLKDKQQMKPLIESSFLQGLVDTNPTTNQVEPAKPTEMQAIEQGMDIEEDHASVKLSMPTAAQQAQSQRIRKVIKQMKDEDKITVLMEIFKIKKQYQDSSSIIKKMKCPIYFCQKKSYKDIQQLKNHLKTKHPQLSKHGIELSQHDGTFEYGNKAMDLALFIGKIFPQEMKKIIRLMKTKSSE